MTIFEYADVIKQDFYVVYYPQQKLYNSFFINCTISNKATGFKSETFESSVLGYIKQIEGKEISWMEYGEKSLRGSCQEIKSVVPIGLTFI